MTRSFLFENLAQSFLHLENLENDCTPQQPFCHLLCCQTHLASG